MSVTNERICPACGKAVPAKEESCLNCSTWMGFADSKSESSPEHQDPIEPLSSDQKMESEVSDSERRRESSDSELSSETERVSPKDQVEAQKTDELTSPIKAPSPEEHSPLTPCPFCGRTHPPEARFCPFTGGKLIKLSPCPQCGKNVQPAWVVCVYCGFNLGRERTERRTPVWQQIWIYAFVGVVFITVLGVFFIPSLVGQLSALQEKPSGLGVELPISTATPQPSQTETLLPTGTPIPPVSPSPTMTQSLTPTLVPTLTPTPTPTLTLSPTLQEGFSIVPNVVGMDFYSAGLTLEKEGFTVKKEGVYNPNEPLNTVYEQDPEAGSYLEASETVTIYFALDSKLMYSRSIKLDASTEMEYYVDLPGHIWCQLSLVNIEHINSSYAYLTIAIYPPEYEGRKLATVWSEFWDQQAEFITTSNGSYLVIIWGEQIEADFSIWCKP